MYPVEYYDIVKDYANPFNLRVKMVQYALKEGLKKGRRNIKRGRT